MTKDAWLANLLVARIRVLQVMNEVKDVAFKKVDLHIHTPRSACYSDPSVTTEQIVNSALAAELSVIAITDHNTVEAVDGIRQVAEKKGIFAFPGIELTTRGGHIISIFDLDTPVERLRDFLDNIGITRQGWGDAAIMASDGIEEVLQKIVEWGGLAIAAHIERWPSGFLQTNQPRQVKMIIHSSDYLSALEITVPQNRGMWHAGQVRGYPKKYACIQGSDAHALDEIGRRPVHIRMKTVNLESLYSAFNDYETKIIFPDDFHLCE